MTASKSLIENLYEFLLMKGILNPDDYEYLKFSGGSDDESLRYVAIIPYVLRHICMYTIILPYRRVESKKHNITKPEYESTIEIIEREFFQETGLHFNKDYLVEILPRRKKVPSFNGSDKFHEQIFYSIRLGINMVQRMKMFKGPNNEDREKAMPLFVKVSEVIELLAAAHLVALRNLLAMLVKKQDDLMLIDTRSENDLMLRHLRHLLDITEKQIVFRKIEIEE